MNLRVIYNARTVNSAPQSSPALRRLPACVTALALAFGAPLAGQQRVAPTSVRKAPAGVILADLPSPATLTVSGNQGRWAEVTLDGWIYGRSIRADRRQGLDVVVSERGGENLRAEPNGAVIARLRYGALLDRIEARGDWVHVRRRGWVPRSALDAPMTARARPPAAARTVTPPAYREMAEQKADTQPKKKAAVASPQAPAQAPPPSGSGSGDQVELTRGSELRVTPDGAAVGTLAPGAAARVLARSGDWARVATEGWVRDADLRASSSGALAGVSAAEVRANPDRYVGQVLDWRLQLVSIQRADELRPEMPAGQDYLLTRGPLPEPGFVYVTISDADRKRFSSFGPLAELTLRVKIRAARSRYLATPVAELVSIVDSVAAGR
jgi:hypothetical protein